MLHICSAISGDKNKCWNSDEIGVVEWVNIQISQHHSAGSIYNFEIRINNALVKTFENTDARVFTDVKVYASDPWHHLANATIRNFFVTMKPGKFINKPNST